jgi:hypothetical protein
MSEKPPLSDSEVYDRLHEAWLMLAKEAGETEYGNNTLKAARLALFTLQAALVKRSDELKDRAELSTPPPS